MMPKVKSTTTPLPHKSNWKIPPNKIGLIAQSSSIKQTNFGITITSKQIPWCEWHAKVHFFKTENLCEKGTLSFQLFKMKMPRWLYFGGGPRNIFVALPLLFIIVVFLFMQFRIFFIMALIWRKSKPSQISGWGWTLKVISNREIVLWSKGNCNTKVESWGFNFFVL